MSFLFREMTEAGVHRLLQNKYFRKFRKILMKTSASKSQFNKAARFHSATSLRKTSVLCLPANSAKVHFFMGDGF